MKITHDSLLDQPVTPLSCPEAVRPVSASAQARLPETLHGALQRATALVLQRHVFPTDDGKHAQVLSLDGERWYPVNGHCTCMDATKAPQGLCKHRLAAMIYKRASELLPTSTCGVATPAAAALPEAPASVNVRLCIDGHECQFTMRDADEARLVERLQALLTRFPQQAKAPKGEASVPAQTSGETPTCAVHGPMKQSNKAPGTWFCSKKLHNGSYCT